MSRRESGGEWDAEEEEGHPTPPSLPSSLIPLLAASMASEEGRKAIFRMGAWAAGCDGGARMVKAPWGLSHAVIIRQRSFVQTSHSLSFPLHSLFFEYRMGINSTVPCSDRIRNPRKNRGLENRLRTLMKAADLFYIREWWARQSFLRTVQTFFLFLSIPQGLPPSPNPPLC